MIRASRYFASAALCFASVASAQTSIGDALNEMPFRNLGPFRPAAWVTSVAVPDAPVHEHLYTIWVGVRSGGV